MTIKLNIELFIDNGSANIHVFEDYLQRDGAHVDNIQKLF